MFHLFRQSNKRNFYHLAGNSDILSYLPHCDNFCFASTGRSLINFLIRRLGLTEKDTCLMPSYVAEGAICAFIHSGVQVQFYKVDEKLFAKLDELEEQIASDSSVKFFILIHPFGFEQPVRPIEKLFYGKDVFIFEDCAQALFSKDSDGNLLGGRGDFSLFSLNKFLPVPDGAILQSHLTDVKIADCVFESESEERRCSINDYIRHLHLNFEMFQSRATFDSKKKLKESTAAYEKYYNFINRNLNLYSPCTESFNQLRAIDYKGMISQRIINTQFLYDNFKNSKFQFVYEKWNKNCVPMAVPVYVAPERREEIILKLFEKNILLSTLVDKWDFIPENNEAKFTSERKFIDSHLLIPVNEFLSACQMEKIVKELNKI